MNTNPRVGSDHGMSCAIPVGSERDESEPNRTVCTKAIENEEGAVALVCNCEHCFSLAPQHNQEHIMHDLGTAPAQRSTSWFVQHFPTIVGVLHRIRTRASRQTEAPVDNRAGTYTEDPVPSICLEPTGAEADPSEQRTTSEMAEEVPALSGSLPVLCCYACATSDGARENNEDFVTAGHIAVSDSHQAHFLALADGMGGYLGGRVAAAIAVQTVAAELARNLVAAVPGNETQDVGGRLQQTFCIANDAIAAHAGMCPELAHMGTTLCASLMIGNCLYTANIGDTRAYLFRDGELTLLTHDDSLLQDLIDSGAITSEEARNHPLDNVVTKALAADEHVDRPAVTEVTLAPRTVVFLCSDGFWKFAESALPETLNQLVTGEVNSERLRTTALLLVDIAVSLGSDDNVSVALLWVDSTMK